MTERDHCDELFLYIFSHDVYKLTYFSFHNRQESNLSTQPENTKTPGIVQNSSTKNSAVIRHSIY